MRINLYPHFTDREVEAPRDQGACPRSPSGCAPPNPPILFRLVSPSLRPQIPHLSNVCPAPDLLFLLGWVKIKVGYIPSLLKTLLWLPIALKIKTYVPVTTHTSCVVWPQLPSILLLASACILPLPPISALQSSASWHFFYHSPSFPPQDLCTALYRVVARHPDARAEHRLQIPAPPLPC